MPRGTPLFLSGNSVSTESFTLATGTSSTLPYAVEVVSGGIHQQRFVGEDTRLEVTIIVAFHLDFKVGSHIFYKYFLFPMIKSINDKGICFLIVF